MTTIIAEYNIGGSGPDVSRRNVRRIQPDTGWIGFAYAQLDVAEAGHPLWLHNIGGLGLQASDGLPMSPLQWLWAGRQGLNWLADDAEFEAAIKLLRLAGAPFVVPYIGSPRHVPWYLWRWFTHHCDWLIDTCGAIGFDATFRFEHGEKVDRLIRHLTNRGLVFCEGRPIHGETHDRPDCIWTERIEAYQRRAAGGSRRGRTGDTWAGDQEIAQRQAVLVQNRTSVPMLNEPQWVTEHHPVDFLIVRRNHWDDVDWLSAQPDPN